MARVRFLILLFLGFFLLGCVTPAPDQGPTATSTPFLSATPTPEQEATATPYDSPYPSADASVSPYDAPPRVSSTTARPTNPERGQPFVIEVKAEDDLGVKTISWTSFGTFTSQPQPSFDCGSEKTCSVSWTFKTVNNGATTIAVYATDSSEKESTRSDLVFNVQPFDYKEPSVTPVPTPTPSPSIGPVCGNAVCDAKEGFEVCPADCPYSGFACANGKCEGGESYQSCPQDCGVSDIIGSSCGDGACEPGEDAAYCSKDCASIKPNCGNNICDPWETQSSCRADCEGATGDAPSCTSNEACGYKQICRSGKCVSVDCTNDAQCGYGKECESNRCKRCPSGPYGPAC